MLKLLFTAALIYFTYKYMFRNKLQQPKDHQQQENLRSREQQTDHSGDEDEYIDYEEVE